MESSQKTRFGIRMNFLNVPKRYATAQMSDFDEHVATKAKNAAFITGKVGRGKTHLLYALAKQAVLDSINNETVLVKYNGEICDTVTAVCASIPELLAKIKRTFSKESEKTEEEIVRMLCITQNLYIDDFGTHSNTGWEFATIFRILDYRYAHMLNTVIASNLTLSEIAQNQSSRLASRLVEMGETITFQQNDRRANENNS